MSKKIILGLIVVFFIGIVIFLGYKIFSFQQSKSSAGVSPSLQIYKNEKYNFTIEYPAGWTVDEDKTLIGPGFRPKSLSMQDIQSGKIDKAKDCYFQFAFLSVTQTKSIPCKNNLGEITLGSNKFTKCNRSGEISYMLAHPKTENLFDIRYLNNYLCKTITEKILATLNFFN
jgi:hypothetical protein